MVVTAERFNQGMTYDQFKAQLSRARESYERNDSGLQLTDEDLAPFRAADPFKVLVIVTETCPDVINNLPILVRIGQETGNFEHRIFMRDDNKDLMAQFMNGPYESVPVFAFFDANFKLRGVFIERPRPVTALREQKTREIHEAHPEFGGFGDSAANLPDEARDRLRSATQAMREETIPYYRRETVRELQELVTAMRDPATVSKPVWVGNLMMAVPA